MAQAMRLATVQKRGQVTLPMDMRRRLDIEEGGVVAVIETEDTALDLDINTDTGAGHDQVVYWENNGGFASANPAGLTLTLHRGDGTGIRRRSGPRPSRIDNGACRGKAEKVRDMKLPRALRSVSDAAPGVGNGFFSKKRRNPLSNKKRYSRRRE